MRTRIFIYMMMLLCHLSAIAQTDGYNPSNPPNPSVPESEQEGYYRLTVSTSPVGMGSVNTNGGAYKEGSSLYLRAYVYSNQTFRYWMDDEGNTLSTSTGFYYTMPARNVHVTAVYSYNPSSPDNPDSPTMSYTLTLKAKPEGTGSFSPNKAVKIQEGTTTYLSAYTPNSDFKFVRWEDEQGNLVSTAQYFYYTMPAANTTLYGVFEYVPGNPANPGKNAWDSFSGEVIVDDFTPGNLSSAISQAIGNSSSSDVTHIVVAGKISTNDFSIANSYSNCSLVDLSRTTGATYVPSYCYYGNTQLAHILLPSSIESIEYRAFCNCSSLETITLYAVTPPTIGSYAFEGVPTGMTVYVPEGSIELYEAAEGWKDMIILPIKSDVHSLELNLPEECKDGRYKNMALELVNIKSGQKYKYVVTDRLNYIFSNLMKNTTYNAYLKNLSGVVLAEIDSIKIDDLDRSLTFSDIKTLQTVGVQVLDGAGSDVTDRTTVRWYDESGKLLSQNSKLEGQVEGTAVKCSVSIPEELGMQYQLPADSVYRVTGSDNKVVCQLQAIPSLTLKGNLYDLTTGLPLPNAVITVTQSLNGLYTKAFTAKTDNLGTFQLHVLQAPTTVNYALDEYLSQTVELAASDMAGEVITLQDAKLKSIVGVRITVNYTYRNSVLQGAEAETQNWYSDYNNVSYAIFDKTAQKAITAFNVQYPTIVLLEEVAEGNVLEVTATSKTNRFMPVKVEGTVDATNNMSVTVPVVQLGGIKASFGQTENSGVVSMLYDSAGNLIDKYSYSSAELTINNLNDSTYTLITMGESSLFNSFSSLSGFDEAGLVQNVDYVKNEVSVQSGVITAVKNVVVPFFDESKLYYTGDNTLFSVNKSNVVAGHYLTLQAKLDFKPAYRNLISDVELVFPMPEGMSYVSNSMMVGSQLSVYQEDNGMVSVQLGDEYDQKVRFCVIPTKSGKYAPNAFVRFKIGDKTIQQPIGTANCKVEDLKITVPSLIPTDELVVRGIAMAKSSVTLYDGSEIIGTTTATASGSWTISTHIVNPYNLSVHPIYAEVVTKDGNKIVTETKECEYNVAANHVKTVSMSFYNGWYRQNLGCVWDFETKTTSVNSYSFYTTTDFTFVTEFADNSPENLSDVYVVVFCSDGSKVKLPAKYDTKLNRWVASRQFTSYNLPVNVNVKFTQTLVDGALSPEYLTDAYAEFADIIVALEQEAELIGSLKAQIDEELAKDAPDFDLLAELYKKYHALLGIQEIPYTDGELMTDEEVEALKARLQAFQQQFSGYNVEELLKAALRNISYEGTDEESGLSYKISVSTCEGYVEAELDANEFHKISTTDGKVFYVKALEDAYTMLDFTNDIAFHIELTVTGGNGTDAGDKPFVENMREKINWISDNIEKVREATNHILAIVQEVKDQIDNGVKGAQDAYGAAYLQWMRMERLEKQGSDVDAERKNLLKGICEDYETVFKGLKGLKTGVTLFGSKFYSNVFGTMGIISSYYDCKSDLESFISLYNSVPDPCENDQEKATAIKNSIAAAGISAALFYVGNINTDVCCLWGISSSLLSAPATSGASLGVALASVAKLALSYGIRKAYGMKTAKFKRDAKKEINSLKCKMPEEKEEDDDDDESLFEPIRPILDPSGFVYEGVQSNRLQGVTATCYYKETVEDDYGDKHEVVGIWDAEEYAQKNPLFTDEYGMYAWDVPEGLWQVKFEKEGYQTTYSEWLPVPPPQLEVNIGMVQNTQPEVKSAKAYEDGVEIEFTKYMKPETLTADNLYLKLITGETETLVKDATVDLVNVEDVSEKDATQYASKVALKTATDLGLVDEVYVIVSNKVQSYAGIQMAETYTQKLDVEKKVREIKADETYNVGYEQAQTITVGALPNDASKGKTLLVKAASNLIASIEAEGATVDEEGYTMLTLDENGQASLTVNGELLGTTALAFKMADSDISAQSIVKVLDPAKLVDVKEAVASRISGTSVYRGQTVTLSCETEGATIYYTLDGSCPCDEATRVKYDGKPIAINEAMTLKVMAVGENGSESKTKEYTYSIKQTQLQLNLAEGWNWSSHNQLTAVAAADLRQEYVNRVLTQTHEIYNDPVLGFVGNMPDVTALMGIKVETKSQAVMAMSGEQFNPNATAMELAKGWNWIGYPLDQTMSVAEALSKLEAEEGDVLTNLEGGYANYTDGVWTGTLNTMTPGQGYLYKSASGKSFVYNDAIVSNAKSLYSKRLETDPAPWTVNVHGYPNMMCLTAELYDNGMRTSADEYHVGAFVGNECRGVGKWVDGKLYMAVYGGASAKEQVVFRAVERESGKQSEIQETLVFSADAIGTTAEPYTLNLGETTGITNIGVNPGQTEGIYNVMGVQVRNINHEGVYIVNGQKVLINKRNVNEYAK